MGDCSGWPYAEARYKQGRRIKIISGHNEAKYRRLRPKDSFGVGVLIKIEGLL
jgi:hypothetical protein